jgi:hypothetical protein
MPEHHNTRKPSKHITFTAESIKNTKTEKHPVNTKNSASKPALVTLFIETEITNKATYFTRVIYLEDFS